MSLSRTERARIQQIARGRSDESLRVLEGVRAVRDALSTGAVAELWLRADLDVEVAADLAARAKAKGAVVGEGGSADFDRLSGVVTSQGVLALVRDVGRPLADVVALPGLLLWLDGLQDPGNVGAVVRVAAAFGAAGFLVGEGSADPLGLKALRASTGLALRLPFARAGSARIAEALAAAGREVYSLDAGGDDLFALEHAPGDLVLALGAEGGGLGEAATTISRRRLGIPLAPGVDSLNVAVAAGIAVAHLARVAGLSGLSGDAR